MPESRLRRFFTFKTTAVACLREHAPCATSLAGSIYPSIDRLAILARETGGYGVLCCAVWLFARAL